MLGYDIRTESLKIKREVGYMTQKFSFYEDLTIAENLEFVARLYRLKPAGEHVDRTLEDLGLTSRRDQLAGTLSGGWKQRLALAACIMHKPKLLLLDEPTAGVDPKARREFWDEIHRLARGGLTVLVSTHYMDEAERCHRISYISYGKMLATGTVEEVVRDSRAHHLRHRRARARRGSRSADGQGRASTRWRRSARRCMSSAPTREARGGARRHPKDATASRSSAARPASRMCSSSSWPAPRTTCHELRCFSFARLRRAAHQGVHPDAARPHHLRDDARRAADAARAVRLCHQQRPEEPAGRPGRHQQRPLHARHGLGAAGDPATIASTMSSPAPARPRR